MCLELHHTLLGPDPYALLRSALTLSGYTSFHTKDL